MSSSPGDAPDPALRAQAGGEPRSRDARSAPGFAPSSPWPTAGSRPWPAPGPQPGHVEVPEQVRGPGPASSPIPARVPQDHHHEDAGYVGGAYGPAGEEDDQLWAMVAYLGLIFFAFLPPAAVYLIKRGESAYVRYHAAQALNLWITVFCYTLSFVIIGGILMLDTVSAGLSIGIPLIVAAGVAMLGYAVRGAAAASRGSEYRLPNWICVQMVR
jgi:uncharacterized protein